MLIVRKKSVKLKGVCYDIRGAVLDKARQLEEEGYHVLKLNIGNLGAFGFEPPDEMQQDMIRNLVNACAYSDSKGIFPARRAVVHYSQSKNIRGVDVEDVYIGNGASELIVMAMSAMVDSGDEVLIPVPDYPLWTAAVSLSGGRAVHYRCEDSNAWLPDLDDLQSKITSRTRALVVINPNNPTGALYPDSTLSALVEIARKHRLVLCADEIYDKMLYDGARHTALASLSDDVLTLTFGGLSKNYRACGYRTGWMFLSGDKRGAEDYIEGLNILASMRLCPNVTGQFAIQSALGGYQSIEDLVGESGRLCRQRDVAYKRISAIPGVSVVKPQAALYLFARLDPQVYPYETDTNFILDLLNQEKVLLVQGSGFNWPDPHYFRLAFLPHEDDLQEAVGRIERYLSGARQRLAV